MRAKILSVVIAGAIGTATLAAAPAFAANSTHSKSAVASPAKGHRTCPSPVASGTAGSVTPPVSTPAAGKCDPAALIEAAIQRLTDAANKENGFETKGVAIEPKIDQILAALKAKGVDTSSAQETYGDFKTNIAQAQGTSQGVPALLKGINPSDVQGAKQILVQARTEVKAAAANLKQAGSDLKTLRSDWQSLKGSLGSGGGTGSGSTGSGTGSSSSGSGAGSSGSGSGAGSSGSGSGAGSSGAGSSGSGSGAGSSGAQGA